MLGDKIYLLRKNRNISQEEFAEILNTSRQAVSKWERNESKPDIDKLISIAKVFNVSIDYLLSYEISFSNIDEFIDILEHCVNNNIFSVDIDDLKMWCSKYYNNFKLHINAAYYLFVAYIDNNNSEYLDLALNYINQAISLFIPEYNDVISLNDLHCCVAEIYLLQKKYNQAKEYAKKNNVYGCDVLLTKCEYFLEKYEDALDRASNIYIKSVSDIMNVSFIQILVLLKNEKIEEAHNLVNWSISFINSIHNDNDLFENIIFPFMILKATCECILEENDEKSINQLKELAKKQITKKVLNKTNSLKYYFGKTTYKLIIETNFKNVFLELIQMTSKNDFYYECLIKIYNTVFGETINE